MREADVREAVRARIARDVGGLGPARVIEELGLCQAEVRVDIAVIDRRITGWEIKSAADTLTRLPAQAAVYNRVFDRMWLAADQRHLTRAATLVPSWWGLAVIEVAEPSRCKLKTVRPSRLNREVDLRSLVQLLWRDEAYDELVQLGLADGLRRATRTELWAALAEASPRHISRTGLQARVRARLKARAGWRVDAPHR